MGTQRLTTKRRMYDTVVLEGENQSLRGDLSRVSAGPGTISRLLSGRLLSGRLLAPIVELRE